MGGVVDMITGGGQSTPDAPVIKTPEPVKPPKPVQGDKDGKGSSVTDVTSEAAQKKKKAAAGSVFFDTDRLGETASSAGTVFTKKLGG